MPGRRPERPSITIFSPSESPLVMIQNLPTLSCGDLTLLGRAVRGHHEEARHAAGIALNGQLGHEEGPLLRAHIQKGAHVHAREKDGVGIREDGAQQHHARALVHADISESELTLPAVKIVCFQPDAHGHAVVRGRRQQARLEFFPEVHNGQA